jgi:hypothetical protein
VHKMPAGRECDTGGAGAAGRAGAAGGVKESTPFFSNLTYKTFAEGDETATLT